MCSYWIKNHQNYYLKYDISYIYIYIYKEGGETLAEAAQKGYMCLIPIAIQGQFGPVLEQSDLVKNVPKPQYF